jgi:hypothetical protein
MVVGATGCWSIAPNCNCCKPWVGLSSEVLVALNWLMTDIAVWALPPTNWPG